MIVDTLDRFDLYARLSPLLPPCLAWLQQHPDAADGRYDIDGDRAFALVQTYTTEPATARPWESHRRYVDLQVVLAGTEWIGCVVDTELPVTVPYDAEKDVAFFDATQAASRGTMVRVTAGSAVLLLPHDVHQPGVAAGPPASVRKVVFKLDATSFVG